ncbi:MAG: dethiobiotin synthase [Nitrospira sp.]|nr:dethiobiotin synthase [Nitrospira sp.]
MPGTRCSRSATGALTAEPHMSDHIHSSFITHHSSIPGIFVTGTDTGVGKTLVTAALACHLKQGGTKVGVMKPVETGSVAGSSTFSDGERLKAGAGSDDPLDLICPYRFPAPLAPLAAARHAGVTIDPERIRGFFKTLATRCEILLVEGVGGVMVPLAEQFNVLDLINLLGLPVLVVGRATLGGVNHALLTVKALRQRDIAIVGFVLNQLSAPETLSHAQQSQATVSLVRELSEVPVVGPLPYRKGLQEDWEGGIAWLAQDQTIRELASLIRPDVPGRPGLPRPRRPPPRLRK